MSIFDTGSYEPKNKVGTIESMLSGIASGFIAIPKGFFSLGASLMILELTAVKLPKEKNFLMILQNLMRKQKQQLLVKLQTH